MKHNSNPISSKLRRGRWCRLGIIVLVISLTGCGGAATPLPPTDTVVPPTSTATALPPTDTLAPTSTSTSTPTRAPTATSLPTGMLFMDEFSSKDASLKNGWSTSGSNATFDWSNDNLVASTSKADLIVWNTPQKFYTDFGAEIEAKPTGSGYIEYGLVFREDSSTASNFYAFGVNTNGQYFLWKEVDGKYAASDPVSLTTSQYIKKDATSNKLGVVAEGSNLSLYINGFLVRKLTDSSLNRGHVGVFVSVQKDVGNKVAFDRFTVYTASQAKAAWGTTLAAGGVVGGNTPATPRPAATKAPTVPPVSKPAGTTVTVSNTFPLSCLIVFWGPADLRLDAGAGSMAFSPINPGTYGWRAFIGGAETGEAGNLDIAAGDACVFVCDRDRLAIRYGCH
jgi:hypothetical protein